VVTLLGRLVDDAVAALGLLDRDLLALVRAGRASTRAVIAFLAVLGDAVPADRFGLRGLWLFCTLRLRTNEPSETDREHDRAERVPLVFAVVRAQNGNSQAEVDDPGVHVLVPVEEGVAMQPEVDHDLVAVAAAEVGGLGSEVESSVFPADQESRGRADRESRLAVAVHVAREPEGSGRHSESESAVGGDVPPHDCGVQLERVGGGRFDTDQVPAHEREAVRVSRHEFGHLQGVGRVERLLQPKLVDVQHLDVALLDVDGPDGRGRDRGALRSAGRAAAGAVIALLRRLVDRAVATPGGRLDRAGECFVSTSGLGVEEHDQGAERQGRLDGRCESLHRILRGCPPW